MFIHCFTYCLLKTVMMLLVQHLWRHNTVLALVYYVYFAMCFTLPVFIHAYTTSLLIRHYLATAHLVKGTYT